ncbi:Mss4-like protein [Limtongia smithiae]|uniref:Mss4-like protein n=1 Tax=Limtongia smithiae TaxID=1125753 RepID=UPI0034CF3334
MPTYTCSCDCGAVTAEVEIEDATKAIVCHCDECKLRYGTFCPVFPVADAKYTITKGADKLKTWAYAGASGNPVPCTFCSECGVNMYRKNVPMAGLTIVIASTLKEPWFKEEAVPALCVYEKNKFSWLGGVSAFQSLD